MPGKHSKSKKRRMLARLKRQERRNQLTAEERAALREQLDDMEPKSDPDLDYIEDVLGR